MSYLRILLRRKRSLSYMCRTRGIREHIYKNVIAAHGYTIYIFGYIHASVYTIFVRMCASC